MEPIVTINNYPIGWEWLDNVPLEDFNWLIEIFATMTDNTDIYDFVFYEDSETLPGHLKRICSVDKIYLANFLNEDQGYESGKFLVSFEVPGPLPGTTEGFCEEMNVVYRTEELNTYLRYPKQQINPWHKHSTYIRLKLREILKVNLTDITIIDIISLP